MTTPSAITGVMWGYRMPDGISWSLSSRPSAITVCPALLPALIADDEVHPVREVVDGLALALVPPLGPEHDRGRHVVECIGGRVRGRSRLRFRLLRGNIDERRSPLLPPRPRTGMTKSKDELEIEKLEKFIEIDGEYCVPHELNEARHVVDWGPFERPRSAWYIVHKFLLFLPAMYLFILAVQIMKTGAAAIGPDIQGQFPFANGISTLGFGWLGAYFVLSGSPVAATAISLFGAGTLTKLQTFTMLSGSRLGASFIVLLTGFLYAARNRHDPNRGEPIGMGIQAMTMTALVYLPGHDDRLRDHPQRAARRAQPARVGGARGGAVRGLGSRRRCDRGRRPRGAPVLRRAPRDLGLVQGPRSCPAPGQQRHRPREASFVDATALDDVRARAASWRR